MVGLKLNNNIGKEVSWRIPPQPSLLYSLWMGYPAPYYEDFVNQVKENHKTLDKIFRKTYGKSIM